MDTKLYRLAKLNDAQLKEIKEGESTLGSLNLLALQPIDLELAKLDASQMECLQGLEKNMGLTIVAVQS